VLGRALRQVARDRYLLSTKVGQYGEGEFDFSAARVLREFDASCDRLGVEHVDLLLCHDIEFADLNQIADETLPALVGLRAAGRVRHIGVSGLPLKIFPAIIDRVGPTIVEVILSFCHYELNDSSLLSLLPYLRGRGVGIINASPTGMGLLTERGVPAWHPASAAIVAGCRRAVDFCRSQGQDIVKAAIQYSISHPGIATTLFSTASPAHVERNLAYAEEEIDHVLIARVLEILAPIHNHNFTRGRPGIRDPLYPPNAADHP